MSLANLPSDVVLHIIKFVEAKRVQKLRRISRRWDDIVLSHLCNGTTPAIDYFSFYTIANQWNFRISLDQRYIEYFGVQKWRREKFENNTLVGSIQVFLSGKRGETKLLNRLGLLFGRSLSIREFELKALSQLEIIKNVLGQVKIDNFAASMVYRYQLPWITEFVERHSVKKLTVHHERFTRRTMSLNISENESRNGLLEWLERNIPQSFFAY